MKYFLVINLFFISLTANAFLNVSPQAIYFGDVVVGSMHRAYVNINNNSYENQNITTNHTCSLDYYIYDNCAFLGAYGSCSIQVEYRPTKEGYADCQININGDDGYHFVSIRAKAVNDPSDVVQVMSLED